MSTIPRRYLAAAILLTGATAGFAQQASSPLPRWYIGAAPVLEERVFAIRGEAIGAYIMGGMLYGGYALAPGLTLQLGVLHGRGGSMDDNYADDGTPKYVNNSYKESVWGVPSSLRWRLSKPERRFQVNALTGIRLYAVRQTRTYNQLLGSTSADGWRPVLYHSKGVNGYLDGGLGIRYACTSRLQAVAEVSLNINMKKISSSYLFGLGPGASSLLGLQYAFR
ncbi:hypothetical protein SAMN06265337_3493 [Hymenobacter gelipurpurascens]|uniref:Outer membrane protein beta-barrel domain-containing protein n=1 Tax=Hymenobacter gelipurpurascens TaxID=89968 RepID=A0A212UEH0_9BACT|nr:hypothetical protein [Hymenobacter gelipurpurascens]SNC76649.1 hypothetical protein SAMN06265337_3493 [Hymenobacter gelipurpurascens]